MKTFVPLQRVRCLKCKDQIDDQHNLVNSENFLMRQEVLLSTSSTNNSSILLHDLHTSNHLQSFRDCITSKNGLTMSTDSSIVMAAQMDKGFLHIYQLGKEAIHLKMLLPERIRCVKISPSGTWCAAGSETGKLFLWEVSCNFESLF